MKYIDYIELEKTFPRDTVGLSDEEQAQQLEELYESMGKIGENDTEE